MSEGRPLTDLTVWIPDGVRYLHCLDIIAASDFATSDVTLYLVGPVQ